MKWIILLILFMAFWTLNVLHDTWWGVGMCAIGGYSLAHCYFSGLENGKKK